MKNSYCEKYCELPQELRECDDCEGFTSDEVYDAVRSEPCSSFGDNNYATEECTGCQDRYSCEATSRKQNNFRP